MRFILVDRIESLEPGVSIVATRHVGEDEPYFRDHFPGFPVVPGVLLIEMMAQALGKCLDAERRPRGRAMLAKVRSASFRRWVPPERTLTLRGQVQSNEERYATAKCSVEDDGERVADADLVFSFVPVEQFAAGWGDPILDEFLGRK